VGRFKDKDCAGARDSDLYIPTFAALSADGKTAALGAWKTVRLWDVPTGKMVGQFNWAKEDGDPPDGTAAAFSPDGKLLALGQGGEIEGGKGKITLLEAETGKKVQELTGHEYGSTHLVFSPDGKILASAGRDTLVKLWSMPDGKLIQDLGKSRGGQFKDWIHASAFSPDGTRLAAADMAGQIQLYTLA